tara:strand:+ start:458 stop:841 length:384 start_codon:yes stop_codon:yes gene_type:complete
MNEELLFEFLKLNLYPDLEKAPGIFDAFDCHSAKAGHFIELKCRQTHYTTLLIEQQKYRKLITQSYHRELLPFYINSTPLGIFSFDLTEMDEPEWFTMQMPATTEFAKTEKIDKIVGYLPLEEAIRL